MARSRALEHGRKARRRGKPIDPDWVGRVIGWSAEGLSTRAIAKKLVDEGHHEVSHETVAKTVAQHRESRREAVEAHRVEVQSAIVQAVKPHLTNDLEALVAIEVRMDQYEEHCWRLAEYAARRLPGFLPAPDALIDGTGAAVEIGAGQLKDLIRESTFAATQASAVADRRAAITVKRIALAGGGSGSDDAPSAVVRLPARESDD